MPWVRWYINEAGHHLPAPVAKWVVLLGRAGFVSRGIFYLGIGILTISAAAGVAGVSLERADDITEVVADFVGVGFSRTPDSSPLFRS